MAPGRCGTVGACAAVLVLLCSPAAGGDSPEELFAAAQAASRRNDYAGAERLYRRILAADPNILPARVNLGLACYWQHKSRETISELGQALRASPGEFSALLFSGLAYIDLTEYDRAQAFLERARQVRQQDPLLMWALGSLAMIHSDARAAIPLLEGCASLDPANVRCHWLLGVAYATEAYRDRQTATLRAAYAAKSDEALRWMEQNQSGTAQLHVFKGDVLAARKATPEALAEYQRAMQLDPNWPDLHLLIGSLLGLQGRYDEARAELSRHLRQRPDDTRAILEMGGICYQAGDYSRAIEYLTRALARDSQNYDGNYKLGRSYIALRQFALAVPALQRAARARPADPSPYYLLHRAYQALKQPAEAAAALRRFRQLKSAGS